MQAYTVVVLTVTVILVKSPAEALPCQSFTRGGGKKFNSVHRF